MGETTIQWTDATWNPSRGCALVSPGCTNCYAMKQAHRFSGSKLEGNGVAPQRWVKGAYHGLTRLTGHGPVWTGRARFVPEMLDVPLRWKKPRKIFVNSMSDLFHEDITNEQIAAVFGVMAASPRHTFQVLTKRPERALEWFKWVAHPQRENVDAEMFVQQCAYDLLGARFPLHPIKGTFRRYRWPLLNVWLGVSCEDQQRADEQIPLLLQCPAAIRFVSAEPLLGSIDFAKITPPKQPWFTGDAYAQLDALTGAIQGTDGLMGAQMTAHSAHLDWVIVGGESGPGARPCDVAWIRSILEQCNRADVPAFCKQLGSRVLENRGNLSEPVGGKTRPWVDAARVTEDGTVERLWHPTDRKGGDMQEWPFDLRVRQWPEARA